MNKIRILVCDDHEIIRKGITQLLKLRPNFEVVGEATNGYEAIVLVNSLHPDVVLMDIQMPELNGIEATKAIRKTNPYIKIIMLTISVEEEDLYQAIKNGANGYLLKNTNLEELFQNIKRVYEGTPTFSPLLATKILEQFSMNFQVQEINTEQDYELSEREREVLKFVVDGKTNQYIADHLFISIHTVKKHMQHILEKLHVKNRAEAIALTIRKGLVEEEEDQEDQVQSDFSWLLNWQTTTKRCGL